MSMKVLHHEPASFCACAYSLTALASLSPSDKLSSPCLPQRRFEAARCRVEKLLQAEALRLLVLMRLHGHHARGVTLHRRLSTPIK